MNIRKIALSSAAAIGLVATLGVTSVSAHSRHPATAEENAQTDQLNQQALAAAQGGGTTAPAAPASAPHAMTPDQQGGVGGASTMTPTSPAQNNTGTAMPDQPAPGTVAPNAVTPNTTAPDTTPTPAPSPNDTKTMDNTAAPTAANQDPAAPQPASGIAPKTPQ
jgi:hypothetical protein